MLSWMRMVVCLQLADPQSALSRGKNFFNQMLNVLGVRVVRQMDIHTAEPLMPEPSLVKVEIAVEKLKRYKSLGTDQIPAKLIKAGGETLAIAPYSICNK
jgi:1,2-phenylacetyl-CoA epoxidase PaaB subunit